MENDLAPTCKEIVLKVHPNAFCYDNGTKCIIKIKKQETVNCEKCGQSCKRDMATWQMPSIGLGPSEDLAWRDAAEKLENQ